MKAVRLHAAGDLRVEEIAPVAVPAPGWVRLKVTAAGICGSDLHNFRTGQWISRSPSVAGHEFAGVVTALGDDVTDLAVGDPVVADSRYWCGACRDCREGRKNICSQLGFVGEVCDGGFAEETTLPARLLTRHHPSLDPVVAALAEPLAVALHAVRRLAGGESGAVLVLGCGTIGGLAALLLSRLHRGRLLVADANAARVRLVAEVTGALAVALEDTAIAEALEGEPLRHALDATGSDAAITKLVGLVSPGATVGLVGISHRRLDLDPNLLVEREISLVGCHVFADELAEAVGMLPELAPQLRRFIDREIALDEVPDAYSRLLAGDAAGLKTIVRPHP